MHLFSNLTDMYPRRHIIEHRSVCHVTFRCHNRQFLLAPKEVKVFLLLLWAKYKRKYNVRIYDFIIMDNHVHLMLRAEGAESLAGFMRTVNFQLARFINKYFERDSQAIRERYKSPVINDARYQMNVMKYIWLNRHKANKKARAEKDPFCSASWRLTPSCINGLSGDKEERAALAGLLDSYSSLPEPLCQRDVKSERRLVRKLLGEAYAKVEELFDKLFENSHTIGDAIVTRARAEILSAFRKKYAPIV